MRTIDITGESTVEIWPGRRLMCKDGLFALPKGAMTIVRGSRHSTLNFGGVGKTTVAIVAVAQHAQLIRDAIVEMERPEGAKTV